MPKQISLLTLLAVVANKRNSDDGLRLIDKEFFRECKELEFGKPINLDE